VRWKKIHFEYGTPDCAIYPYRRCPCKSLYLKKPNCSGDTKNIFAQLSLHFVILIFTVPIFELIKTSNSRISFFQTFSQNSTFITYEVLHLRMCPCKTSYLDTCLRHVQYVAVTAIFCMPCKTSQLSLTAMASLSNSVEAKLFNVNNNLTYH